MNATALSVSFLVYTVFLFVIAWFTSRKSDPKSFYFGNRCSHWIVVSFGMIGASVSGVTFLSVPGNVYQDNCYYTPLVLSFFLGYMVIAFVLLPLFYHMNLTSIYTYLERRLGSYSYKTGSAIFVLSRLLGVAIRTYVVIMVLHVFVLKQFGMPFWLIAVIFIFLAILYTCRGGVKTIIWTDTFQTSFILLALVVTIYAIASKLGIGLFGLFSEISKSHYSGMFCWDWSSKSFVLKHVIAGILAPIVMTGLDQGMMQKNLSCKNTRDAQKNIIVYSILVVLFCIGCLFLGVSLAIFCDHLHLTVGPEAGRDIKDVDHIFPTVAFYHLGPLTGLCFFIGLISAAYPVCANAMTAVTTSVCVDLLNIEKNENLSINNQVRIRYLVQGMVTLIFLGIILLINYTKSGSLVDLLYWTAAYTYGPLLALFAFGIMTKRKVHDQYVPWICLLSPIICFLIEYFNLIGKLFGLFTSEQIVFSFGFSLLLFNAILTFLGLILVSQKTQNS